MKFIKQYRRELSVLLGMGFVYFTVKASLHFSLPIVFSLIVIILVYYVGYILFNKYLE